MDLVTQFDGGIAGATQTFFLVLGLWGGYRAIRSMGMDGSFLGAVVIGEGLLVLQLILDVVMWLGGVVPERPGLHYLYAVFAVLLPPFIYASVLKGEVSNQAQWIFTFVCLFLWGLMARLATNL